MSEESQNIDDLISSISLNQILMSILDEHKNLSVQTNKFFEAKYLKKELVIKYDESVPSFVFSLRDKNE